MIAALLVALAVWCVVVFCAWRLVRVGALADERAKLPVYTPQLADFEHRLNREEYFERNNATVDMRACLETCRQIAFKAVTGAKPNA